MKPINDCVNLTNDEIDFEIKERRELIQQMLGWLYPSILNGEIEKLQAMKTFTDELRPKE